MLLSRVAENIYWSARHIERAEGTARIVRAHTDLLVDLPTFVALTWEPLLAVIGSREDFDQRFPRPDEASVVRWLLAEPDNPSSVRSSVERARENLRTTREVLPGDVWQQVNDLHLYVSSRHEEGVRRRTRPQFLGSVIGSTLRTTGVIDSTMSRDEAYWFWRLGRELERADLTTRVIDVRAGTLLSGANAAFGDVQWMGLLRSLSGLQMFHRTMRQATDGPATVRFLLGDRHFPRSVAFCLERAAGALRRLPRHHLALAACEQAAAALEAVPGEAAVDGAGLHEAMDGLQEAVGAVHDAVTGTYFLPADAPAFPAP
jgi:uncharacterized alpha-E superfamily protein